jgi:hypothetical protein
MIQWATPTYRFHHTRSEAEALLRPELALAFSPDFGWFVQRRGASARLRNLQPLSACRPTPLEAVQEYERMRS